MKKLIKITFLGVIGIFGLFLIYANANPKPMHAYAPPTGILFYELDTQPEKATSLESKIESMDGVTSCSYSPETNRMSILFNPEKCSAQGLNEVIESENIKFKTPEIEGESGPECPIPHAYIEKFEKIKYALNFR